MFKDFNVGRDCLEIGTNRSWLSWNVGSRCKHWLLIAKFKLSVIEGQTPWFIGYTTHLSGPHHRAKDVDSKQRYEKEVVKAPQRNYIEPGKVHILNLFFLELTTISDYIMMVYYDNSRKINDFSLSTHFSLTTFYMKTRKIQEGN